MRRNKIVLLALSVAALVVSACSNPVAPTSNKADCGTSTGGQICLK
jgi:hypothetical protein